MREHSPLEAIHAVVIPDFVVQIFFALRVIAERTRAVRYGCIVRDQSAAFPVRTEVFTRIKTETRNLAKLAYAPALVPCSVRLRSIFDHRYPMSLGNRIDAVHLCRHSVQMHRDNCLGPGRDRRFEVVRVQRAADRVNIDEHWRGADVANGPCACYEGHRNGEDFVSRPDIEAAQGQMQRARAAVQADTMINSAVRREFRLEL